jgi:CRP-like cAMP-binding protein
MHENDRIPMTATALTPCQVYRLSLDEIRRAQQRDPELALLMQNCLQDQVSRRTVALAQVLTLSPAERLKHLLSELSAVLRGKSKATPRIVQVPICDEQIAMLIGLSTRQFKRVKREVLQEGSLRVASRRSFIVP